MVKTVYPIRDEASFCYSLATKKPRQNSRKKYKLHLNIYHEKDAFVLLYFVFILSWVCIGSQ